MPPYRKKKTSYWKPLIWLLIIALIVLMIISFAPTQHMNEIVLYP